MYKKPKKKRKYVIIIIQANLCINLIKSNYNNKRSKMNNQQKENTNR